MPTDSPRRGRVEVTRDGPYLVTGGVPLARVVEPGDGAPRALRTNEAYTLCRCGASARKPFCDGSHRRIGFDGTESGDGPPPCAGPAADEQEPRVLVLDDGPLALVGGITVRRADGSVATAADTRLCRCGASARKPFCDDSHCSTGFRDGS